MNVFVSRPTWVADEFEDGLKTFHTQLSNLGLTPRTLGTSDYPSKSPLDEVIKIMSECSGAVILGYPQILLESGLVKGKKLNATLTLATEWNHIEASLAYANKLPLLVIHHLDGNKGYL